MKAARIRSVSVWWAVACGLTIACAPVVAQVSSLNLSSATSGPGSGISLALSLATGSTSPAGVQWTFTYSPSQISGVSATAGPAITAAGKTLSCAGAPGSFTCVAAGLNTNSIGSGVVASVQVTMAPTATTTSVNITNPVGVSAGGSRQSPFTTTPGVITVPALTSTTCTPASLNESQSATCSITLNMAAPAGGMAISLRSNNVSLTVPASVMVAGGATTATFSATAAGSVTSNQSATVTATLGGSSQSAGVNLVAPVQISGVSCSPTSLGQSAVGNCTVLLNQNAPAGGMTVMLASNNALLTVPAAVTVPAGMTSVNFNAMANASIPTNENATVTATLATGSQTVTLGLVAPLQISSLSCNPPILGPGGVSNCGISLTQAVAGISLVHVTSCGPQSFPTSTCTIPATGSGNLIVVGWQSGGGVSPGVTIAGVTDSAGNSYAEAGAALAADTAAGAVADVWYAMNSVSGATTITVTPSSAINGGGAVIWEFSGADQLAALDQTAVLNNQAAMAAPSGATLTTTAANDVVISLTTAGNVTGIFSGNAFMSDSTVEGTGWAHLITTAAGPYTAEWSTGSAATYASSTVAFRAAGNVMLTSSNPLMTVPASVTVPVGGNSATFGATASQYIPANQNAPVKATLGSSSQTVAMGLVAPVVVSSVTCNAAGVMSGGSILCSVTLSQAVAADTTVALQSNSTLLAIPAGVTISAGTASSSATAIAGTVLSNASAVVSATLGASSQSATVLLWPTPNLTSLTCAPVKIAVGTSSSCTVALSNAAGNLTIGISSSNAALAAPASVAVAQGSSSAGFTVTAQAVAAHSIALKASWNGVSLSQSFAITAVTTQLQSISCEPGRARRTCRVAFKAAHVSGPEDLALESSNQSMKVPESISVQPGQSSVRFQIEAIPPIADHSSTITAQLGGDVVRDTVSLESLPGPLGVPKHVYAKYGEQIEFRVSASDPAATLAAWDLPAGAIFDPGSGVFQWVPDVSSQGTRTLVFTETGSGASSITATSIVEVGPDSPVVTRVVNAASRSEAAACSPGAIASLEGRWLAGGQAVSDPSGRSTVLGGSVVRVNGVEAPILAASASRVDFVCPAAVPGSSLDIALQTSNGMAQTIRTISMEATPGIFSVDGSGGGQGAVMHAGTATLAMVPNYRYRSREALPDEMVTIYSTGIAAARDVSIVAGGVEVSPQSIEAMTEQAGMYEVTVRLPAGLADGDMPVSLKVTKADGTVLMSNTVWIATEMIH